MSFLTYDLKSVLFIQGKLKKRKLDSGDSETSTSSSDQKKKESVENVTEESEYCLFVSLYATILFFLLVTDKCTTISSFIVP